MQHTVTENTKYRLTEPADIQTAIRILRLRHVDDDELTTEITRLFYVDLDLYNEVLGEMH